MLALAALLLAPWPFLGGDVATGLLAVATVVLLVAVWRVPDAERRNEIALAVLLYLDAVVVFVSARFHAPLGVQHLVLLCMAFVLIERERSILRWAAGLVAIVLLIVEPIVWASEPRLSWGVLGGAVASGAGGLGTLVMLTWLSGPSSARLEGLRMSTPPERHSGAQHELLRSGDRLEVSGTSPLPEVEAPASKGRALVVDDNPINLKVALRNLAKLGCEVLTATDGREAVALVQEHEVDLVFMDIQMPVMDGFEATRTIRAQEKGSGKRLPIVAMTAHSMAGYKELCLRAGMDGYITKPLRMTDMVRTLSRWIEGSWGDEDEDEAPGTSSSGGARDASVSVPTQGGSQTGSAGVLGELDAPLLDRGQLDEATDGDAALASELLSMLFETSDKSLEQASRALVRGDQDEARRAIHSVKGAAATLGAARLAQACKRVEGLRPEQLARGVEEARAEFSALRDAHG
ncbi:response regulator [Paraliomyxa miuraensis]|uniref:response regulator n=1 Tax=Paraliomyxa miuraensis TaxID=376150 RepID=UPI0022536E6D|nr:response regulator [Paraliomyxa miuraensis]MCX4239998.1 response regulator [Paraliomyxa miuraensis]